MISLLFPWSRLFPEFLTDRIIRHMSLLERVIESGPSSQSLVDRMINILKDVEKKYGNLTFIVVGHSLGQNEHK